MLTVLMATQGGADGNGLPFAPYPKSDDSRQPLSTEYFETELKQRNAELTEMSQPTIGREEFVSVRLYTGPMYSKCAPPSQAPFPLYDMAEELSDNPLSSVQI